MRHPIRLTLSVVIVALALLAAACGGGSTEEPATTGDAITGPDIVIGAQDFGESAILAEIYSQALADAGFTTRIQTLGGYRDIEMGAFERGEINFAPEYVASMLEFLNNKAGEASGDLDASYALLQEQLDGKGLQALAAAPGVDTNAFVVTAATAERYNLRSLADLADVADELRLGGPADCQTNPFCIPGLQRTYGADLSARFVPLDSGVVATALTNGEIDVAVLFSTDGRIDAEGWVLLTDPQQMLAADNIVPVVTAAILEAYGDALADVVNNISNRLTTEELISLNRAYDVDKESPRDIAARWLSDQGLR
jgi:osmoprotectant transport system substrate-binding protein